MRVLIVNAGSSSVKLSVLDERDELLASENVPAPGGQVDQEALEEVVDRSRPIDAVGHRVVHGGTEFTQPVLVDAAVSRRLEALTDLAPLHQPKSLQGLRAVSRVLPEVPAVACFDTAFHATIPAAASTYALPAPWRRRWELRRYGFHGLSHAYASRRVAEMMGSPPVPRLVTCHLGAGASLAAVRDGVSVDTTMGFTPLEGLVMATRSGSVDPGLLIWLEEHVGMPPAELASTLEHRSGLFGLTGTGDMRQVLAAEAAGEPDAILAMEVYLHRLRGAIAAMAAALGGLGTLVFTGGVGEHSAPVRARAAAGLGFLGVALDEDANASEAGGDRELTKAGAAARAFVIEAREDK
ncbi:MAG TPA: acetate/propionate family kinase, partial [Acidimicrobiales bacterium]|nr:acetate/propionate family kinase [Acidimicrobiales bacterium]